MEIFKYFDASVYLAAAITFGSCMAFGFIIGRASRPAKAVVPDYTVSLGRRYLTLHKGIDFLATTLYDMQDSSPEQGDMFDTYGDSSLAALCQKFKLYAERTGLGSMRLELSRKGDATSIKIYVQERGPNLIQTEGNQTTTYEFKIVTSHLSSEWRKLRDTDEYKKLVHSLGEQS